VSETITTSTATKSIPIEVVGTDLDGMQFIEPSSTLRITRDGATILLENKLAPESELVVRNLKSGEEALGRVVGMMKGGVDGHIYGIAIPQQAEKLWGVQFPRESAQETHSLMCSACQDVVAASLLNIEEEVLEANRSLARSCDNCGAVTIWNQTDREAASARPKVAPALPAAIGDEKAKEISTSKEEKRATRRAAIKMVACVRYSGIETVVACEDMSRGGFRFHCKTKYPVDLRFEAAVPYAKSGANIFMPAKIIYCQEIGEGEYRHGVAYLKSRAPADWSR
jgi:hypothetical protein